MFGFPNVQAPWRWLSSSFSNEIDGFSGWHRRCKAACDDFANGRNAWIAATDWSTSAAVNF